MSFHNLTTRFIDFKAWQYFTPWHVIIWQFSLYLATIENLKFTLVMNVQGWKVSQRACANPESFFREGPIWLFLFLFLLSWWGQRGSKYNYKRAIIGPPAKCHLNGGPTLNAGLVAFWFYRGSGLVSLRNPIFLWFFRGEWEGGGLEPQWWPFSKTYQAHFSWSERHPL